MKEISLIEEKEIVGGGSNISGAIISALKGYISIIFEIGQAVGSSIRRIKSDKLCSF